MSENRVNGKTAQILLRLTPTEKEKIMEQAKAARMSVADYLVALSENKKIMVTEGIPQLLVEITRIGTNINQIAHIGNSQKYVSKEQLIQVTQYLNDVKSIMNKILSEIYNSDEHTFQSLERKIDLLIERTDNNGCL